MALALSNEAGRSGATARAPGRVNLIGEHTDYHAGFVLPFAIDLGVTVNVRPRSDGRLRLRSDAYPELVEFATDDAIGEMEPVWARYPPAVIGLLRERGLDLRGADIEIAADLPAGAGLSSSAALLAATALAAIEAGRGAPELDRTSLARICRDAEERAAGVRCGIMDPLVSLRAEAGQALLIDCRSLRVCPVPLVDARLALVVADTGVRRALARAEYNRRREEGEEAARLLDRPLRDLDPADLDSAAMKLPADLFRRVRHVVTENARTLSAAGALAAGDLETLGRLLHESHESLSDDCDVSCAELDEMVAIAREVDGVYGSRMTGGGFGGATVTAVEGTAASTLIRAIEREYPRRTGRRPTLRIVRPSGPASLVTR